MCLVHFQCCKQRQLSVSEHITPDPRVSSHSARLHLMARDHSSASLLRLTVLATLCTQNPLIMPLRSLASYSAHFQGTPWCSMYFLLNWKHFMEYVWVGLVWFCVLFEIESCVAKDGLKLIMQLATTLNFWSFDLHLPSAGMPDVPGLYGTGGGTQRLHTCWASNLLSRPWNILLSQ